MATKIIQLFITIEELITILKTLIIDKQLKVFLYRWKPKSEIKEIADLTKEAIENFQASRIYLAESDIFAHQIDPNNLAIAKIGLVQVTLPFISHNILMMADIAVKTDWYDGLVKHENKNLDMLFKKIKAFLIKQTFSPVVAISFLSGKERVYSDIRYSKQANAFYESGGEMMQLGVNNIRFRPNDFNV